MPIQKKPPTRKPLLPEDDLPDDWDRPFYSDDMPKAPKAPEPWDGMGLPGYIRSPQPVVAYM